MHVTTLNTYYRWEHDRQVVTERKIEHFDQGNSVTTVIERSYLVQLYSAQGKEKQYPSKGQYIDQSV